MRILALLLLVASLAVAGYWFLNSPPRIHPAAPLKAVGRATAFKIVLDDGNGLRGLRAWWEQAGKTFAIEQRDLGRARHSEAEILLGPSRQKELRDGSARLWVEVTDAAPILPKSQAVSWDIVVRSQPPRLSALSGQHYINQGGSELVVYQVSESALWSGVRVGRRLFPGYPLPGGNPGAHFALFAFPYDEPATTVPQLLARDDAGNEAVVGFWYKLFPRSFRKRDIEVTDPFMQQVVPAILSQAHELQDRGDLLKNFLEINGKLRHISNERIAQFASPTEKRFLWNDAFVQLASSQVEAQFADHRIYLYQGKEIDRQDHLGFDLATVQHAPVAASNRGRVLFADFLGIYGNTLVLDHGYGLVALCPLE